MERGHYTKTRKAASEVLSLAAEALRATGRARKLPDKPRERTKMQFNLVGVLEEAARVQGATRTAKQIAFEATAAEFDPWAESDAKEVVQFYDDIISDTRDCVRRLHRASKRLVAA